MKKIFIILFMLSTLLVSLSAQTVTLNVQGQTYEINDVTKVVISPIYETVPGTRVYLDVYLVKITVFSKKEAPFQVFTSLVNFHIKYSSDNIPVEIN